MGRDSHEYYGSSVTLGLTTFRQSRIPVKLNVLVHVGPACPQTRSLRATHHRERYYCFPPQQCIVVSPVTSRLRWAYCCTVSDIGLAFAFATGSALSFSICTGLAGTTTLPSFTLPRFWSCYRPPGSFLPEVRPSALLLSTRRQGATAGPTIPCSPRRDSGNALGKALRRVL